MTTDELKMAALEISENCTNTKYCEECPFWDAALRCRLQASGPYTWWLDDWKEGKDAQQAQRIAELEQELAAVKRERDAAKSDLCNAEPCFTCLHFRRNGGDCGGGSACREAMGECIESNREYTGNVYEWRGVCPDNTEVRGCLT